MKTHAVECITFHCRTEFDCMNLPEFVESVVCGWTVRLFSFFAYKDQCCIDSSRMWLWVLMLKQELRLPLVFSIVDTPLFLTLSLCLYLHFPDDSQSWAPSGDLTPSRKKKRNLIFQIIWLGNLFLSTWRTSTTFAFLWYGKLPDSCIFPKNP